jgi:hypothetical protein
MRKLADGIAYVVFIAGIAGIAGGGGKVFIGLCACSSAYFFVRYLGFERRLKKLEKQ